MYFTSFPFFAHVASRFFLGRVLNKSLLSFSADFYTHKKIMLITSYLVEHKGIKTHFRERFPI